MSQFKNQRMLVLITKITNTQLSVTLLAIVGLNYECLYYADVGTNGRVNDEVHGIKVKCQY